MDLQGELNRLANIPASERMRGAAGCANLWAGTTNLELVGALNAKLGRAVNGTCLELNGVLKQLGFDLDSNGALVGVDTAGVVGGGGAGVQNVLRLPGLVGNFVSTPDTAALSISGDIDLRAKAALDNWLLPTSGSGSQTFISKENPSNQRSYSFSVTSGILFLRVSVDGTTASTSTSSSASVSFAPGQVGWVRATWRQSDGRVQFFTSTDGVTYTQLGIDRTIAVASIFDGTGLLTLGTRGDTGQNDVWGGYLYYAEVRSGIGGPVVAKFDSTTVAVRGDRLPTTHTQPSTAEAIRLPGVAGNYISQPDSVANSVTGDIDVRAKVELDDWTPATTMAIVAKSSGDPNRSWILGVEATSGKLVLVLQPTGFIASQMYTASTVTAGGTDGQPLWVRATVDVDDGAGNNVRKYYTSSDGVTWNQLGATITTAGAFSFVDVNAPLEIGSRNTGSTEPLAGAIYYAEVRNGINGTVVASFDASRTQPTAQQLPTTQDLWTINGTAWSWDVPITEPSSGALRLPGVSGNYVTTPDAADISITGDIDVRAKLAADDWTPGTFNVGRFMGKWATGQRAWYFTINTSGSLQFGWSTDGINSLSANSSASPAVADGGVIWLRATRNVTTGDVTFYTSPDGITYTQLGTVQTSTPASMIDTTALLEVGSTDSGGNAFQGYLYRAEVYSGIAGTLVAYFDSASAATDTNRTPTTVVQSGRTWTLNGSLWEWVNVPAPTPWTVNGSAWYWGTYSGSTRFLNALQLDPQYVVFDGTTGNYASTPDSAALSITGDIDLRAKIQLDNWAPGTTYTVIGKSTAPSQFSYRMGIISGGGMFFQHSLDGTALVTQTYTPLSTPAWPTPAAGTLLWIRVTRASATGTVIAYTSPDGVTWTQIGTSNSGTGAIFDSTADVEIGAYNGGATTPMAGKVYYTEIRNGIGGSIVGNFGANFARTTAIRTPTTFGDSLGNTWTLNGSAWAYGPAVLSPLVATPDTAALSITGDIDLRAKATLDNWLAMPSQSFLANRGANLGYQLRMNTSPGGNLQMVWGNGAANVNGVSTVVVPFTAGQTGWVRATLAVATGDVKFYTSSDGVTWTQLGATVTIGATAIGDASQALEIGTIPTGGQRLQGLVHYAEVRNGIAGTVVGSFDPQKIRYTGSDTTPTTVPSATGEVYTITGSGWHWVQI